MMTERGTRFRSHAMVGRRSDERHDLFSSKPPPLQTTTFNFPGPSAEEARLRRIQEGLLAAQLSGQKYSTIDPATGNIIQRAPTEEEAQADKLNAILRERVTAQAEGRMPQIPEETRALVNTAFRESQRVGAEDITRQMKELAGNRGLLPSDSPIMQQGLLAQTDLTGRLRGQEANALLNAGQAQNIFAEQARQFQEELRNRSNQNMALLAGQAGQTAMGLAGLRNRPSSQTGPGVYPQSQFGQFYQNVLQPLGSLGSATARGIGGYMDKGWAGMFKNLGG